MNKQNLLLAALSPLLIVAFVGCAADASEVPDENAQPSATVVAEPGAIETKSQWCSSSTLGSSFTQTTCGGRTADNMQVCIVTQYTCSRVFNPSFGGLWTYYLESTIVDAYVQPYRQYTDEQQ